MGKIDKYLKFIGIFIFIFAISNYKIIKVSGNSMSPTLKNGSFALVDLHLYKLFEIQKENLLLLKFENKEAVKKIVGFPGEKIILEDKKISLSEDEIYVLGENLKESIDSREYGPISKKQIIGKVVISF